VNEVRILLSGIRASGRHGANAGERDQPQEFVVDLQVEVEPDIGDDRLEDTADYVDLAGVVRHTVEVESFQLLESLAQAVAGAVLRVEHVTSVRAVVHKPTAAAALGLVDVAVEATAG